MKSAYELAMERLSKAAPTVKLTDDQKRRIAEAEAEYKARVADREIFLKGQIAKAIEKEAFDEVAQIERQLTSDRKTWQAEFEEKKERIRCETAQ